MSTATTPIRATALDALRGLAIIGMILSGHIAHGGVLPAWMHHAQVPPPDHQFDPGIAGITWVDLVFPMFLFAMGMAFPFSLRSRLGKGVAEWRIILQAFKRWGWLFFFALFYQHLIPQYMTGSPGTVEQLLALGGFVLLFAIYGTHPRIRQWKYHQHFNTLGLLLAITYLLLLPGEPKPGDSRYLSLERTDIIILILSNVAFFGAVAWLLTRNNVLPRLALLAVLFALRLSQSAGDNWTAVLWNGSPLPWFFNFSFLQYLHIVLAGSIVGDLAQAYAAKRAPGNGSVSLAATGWLMIALVLLSLTGLFARWGFPLFLLQLGILALTALLLRKEASPTARFLRQLLAWGSAFLIIGMAFEPYEGGIRKDHATLSYYYVTAGLSTFLFMAFFLLLDHYRARGWQWLTQTGRNPMIAYVAPWLLVWPILKITGLASFVEGMNGHALMGLLRGVLITGLSLAATVALTRWGWRWKT